MRSVGFVFMLGMIASVSLIMTPAFGQAETETQIQTIPIEGEILSGSCPNFEDVAYSGNIRSIIHVTTDATGGFHLKSQLIFQNLEGIGHTTGDEYHMTASIGEKQFVSNDGSPITATFPVTLHIRDGISEKGKLLVTLTINANGEPTVEKVIAKVDCT